ncbi:unnamed protein product [Amoebophrya sp. A120]|nr:unnamed protein product [Amoebophrya sp. A120]|eukprot:GSA120T00020412001.1
MISRCSYVKAVVLSVLCVRNEFDIYQNVAALQAGRGVRPGAASRSVTPTPAKRSPLAPKSPPQAKAGQEHQELVQVGGASSAAASPLSSPAARKRNRRKGKASTSRPRSTSSSRRRAAEVAVVPGDENADAIYTSSKTMSIAQEPGDHPVLQKQDQHQKDKLVIRTLGGELATFVVSPDPLDQENNRETSRPGASFWYDRRDGRRGGPRRGTKGSKITNKKITDTDKNFVKIHTVQEMFFYFNNLNSQRLSGKENPLRFAQESEFLLSGTLVRLSAASGLGPGQHVSALITEWKQLYPQLFTPDSFYGKTGKIELTLVKKQTAVEKFLETVVKNVLENKETTTKNILENLVDRVHNKKDTLESSSAFSGDSFDFFHTDFLKLNGQAQLIPHLHPSKVAVLEDAVKLSSRLTQSVNAVPLEQDVEVTEYLDDDLQQLDKIVEETPDIQDSLSVALSLYEAEELETHAGPDQVPAFEDFLAGVGADQQLRREEQEEMELANHELQVSAFQAWIFEKREKYAYPMLKNFLELLLFALRAGSPVRVELKHYIRSLVNANLSKDLMNQDGKNLEAALAKQNLVPALTAEIELLIVRWVLQQAAKFLGRVCDATMEHLKLNAETNDLWWHENTVSGDLMPMHQQIQWRSLAGYLPADHMIHAVHHLDPVNPNVMNPDRAAHVTAWNELVKRSFGKVQNMVWVLDKLFETMQSMEFVQADHEFAANIALIGGEQMVERQIAQQNQRHPRLPIETEQELLRRNADFNEDAWDVEKTVLLGQFIGFLLLDENRFESCYNVTEGAMRAHFTGVGRGVGRVGPMVNHDTSFHVTIANMLHHLQRASQLSMHYRGFRPGPQIGDNLGGVVLSPLKVAAFYSSYMLEASGMSRKVERLWQMGERNYYRSGRLGARFTENAFHKNPMFREIILLDLPSLLSNSAGPVLYDSLGLQFVHLLDDLSIPTVVQNFNETPLGQICPMEKKILLMQLKTGDFSHQWPTGVEIGPHDQQSQLPLLKAFQRTFFAVALRDLLWLHRDHEVRNQAFLQYHDSPHAITVHDHYDPIPADKQQHMQVLLGPMAAQDAVFRQQLHKLFPHISGEEFVNHNQVITVQP